MRLRSNFKPTPGAATLLVMVLRKKVLAMANASSKRLEPAVSLGYLEALIVQLEGAITLADEHQLAEVLAGLCEGPEAQQVEQFLYFVATHPSKDNKEATSETLVKALRFRDKFQEAI